MALIDLWTTHVKDHNFNTGNLVIDEKNYKPHNSNERPAGEAGVDPITLIDIDEEDNQYFKDQNIPTEDTDVGMKNRSRIPEKFGQADFSDGLNSIIKASNTETGYIHHFAGSAGDDFVPGFRRDNTGIRYDEEAAKSDYTPNLTAEDDGTGQQASQPLPLTYEEWVASKGQAIQSITYPKAAYAAYRYAFDASGT